MGNRAVREFLDELTSRKQTTDEYVDAIARASIPGIRPVPPHDARRPALSDQYNCFEYALDLVDSEIYRIILRQFHGGADSTFISYLLRDGTLCEAPRNDLENGDLVLYSDSDGPKHAAKVSGNVVVSKWGFGELWEHDFCDVPLGYGEILRFYKHVTKRSAESKLVEYVINNLRLDPHAVRRLIARRLASSTGEV
jgi:hypothetical protein